MQFYPSGRVARKHARRTYTRLAGVAKEQEEDFKELVTAEPVIIADQIAGTATKLKRRRAAIVETSQRA